MWFGSTNAGTEPRNQLKSRADWDLLAINIENTRLEGIEEKIRAEKIRAAENKSGRNLPLKTRKHHGRLLAHPVSSKNTLVVYRAHGLSCLFAFVRTPGLFYVVEKIQLLSTCAGRFAHQTSQETKTSKKHASTTAVCL